MGTTVADQPRNTLAMLSLGAGVVSLILMAFLSFIGVVLAFVAIVAGAAAAIRGGRGAPIHYIGIVLGLIAIVWFVIVVA